MKNGDIQMEAINTEKLYTYSDYRSWNDGKRYEIINGIAYMLSAPSRTHQKISINLCVQLGMFLEDKPCDVYSAPFDVRLNADENDDIVIQPDISVICDKSKLTEDGCNGAPDLVIEILSKSSEKTDRHIKFHIYLKYGVREYWIVDPDNKIVQVFILDKNNQQFKTYDENDKVEVEILKGCIIDLSRVFNDD